MFCPECKAEYVDGITQCADCHVPLVWQLPEEPQEEAGEPVEWEPLVTTINQADMSLVKAVLESENILYWIQGEHRGMLPHGMGLGAIFHVDKTRIDDARALLSDMDFNAFGFSTRSTDDID